MSRGTKVALGVAGCALALLSILAAAGWLSPKEENVSQTACQPAPGEWLAQVRALVHDYRQPCDQFYWRPEPDGEFHGLVRLNNFGLHAPDYALEKPSGVFRILLIGDSFPQGIQVETDQTFPYLLQTALTQAAGRPVEVINLSVDAYGTDRELLLYALLGWQFHPDLVILSIYAGNDIQDNQIDLEARRYGYRLGRPFFTLDAAGTMVELHNSPVFEAATFSDPSALTWLAGMQANQSAPPEENPPERPRVISPPPNYALEYPVEMGLYLPEDAHWVNAWALTEALLVQFRDLVLTQGTRFAALIIPDRRAVHGDDWSALLQDYAELRPELRQADPTAPNRRLEQFLSASGIPTLDVTWTLRSWAQSNPGQRLYYPDDGHFNGNGHAVTAARLANWLAEQAEAK